MMQTVLVALVVLVAALYVGRRAWRTLRPARGADAGCAHGCGCGDTAGSDDKDWARTT